MKDTIIDGNRILFVDGSPGIFFDGIRLDNSYGKYKRFPVESYDGATLGLINSKVIGVASYSKLGK